MTLAKNYFVHQLPASWYEASLKIPRANYPSLQNNLSCDVCVIGGGFAGLHSALNLAEAGKKVILLEAGRIGIGASGRNGGHVIPEFACSIEVLKNSLGEVGAEMLWHEVRHAAKRLRDLIEKYNIACDYCSGHLLTAFNQRQLRALLAWSKIANQKYGHSYQELIGDELKKHVVSDCYLGGIYEPQGGHLHPLKFALGLTKALISLNSEIYEESKVNSWQVLPNGRISVEVNCQSTNFTGEINAEHLIIATNVEISSINNPEIKKIEHRILPVGTMMVASEPLSVEQAREILPTNAAVCDVRHILSYYRLSSDNRLLFGGRCSYLGKAEISGFAKSLQDEIIKTFPQLHGITIDYAWGGLVDISMSRAPDCRQIDNYPIYYAQGFSGSGVVATAAIGKVISQAILGETQLLRLCEKIPNRNFPGGNLFRAPLTALGNLWYRVMDMI